MSTIAFHAWRHELLGLAVACLTAAIAPSSLAQSAGAAAVTGEVTETQGPVFDLLRPGNFSESFEIACSESVEMLSATVSVSDMPLLGRKAMAAQTKDDTTAAPQEKPPKPSLLDLGIPPDQSQGNAEAQARLDKRSHMLKIHQTLGLITLIPMIATIFAGGSAGAHGSTSSRDLHGALGLVTAGMYITTASYAIRAPSVPGMEVRGPIRVHKALAWVHAAGMILTPILGAMARSQLDRGEKVHGIATAHSAVADVTVAAYAAAIGSVALKF
jgi:hypothetical protein